MQSQALFIIAGFLGLACFITLFIARKWPSSWRYGLLLAGNALLMAAVYFDPWRAIEEKGSRKDLFGFILLNAILIPKIKRESHTVQQAEKGIPASTSAKTEVPPTTVVAALSITVAFFMWALSDRSDIRMFTLGSLLAILGVANYSHGTKGKPTRKVLVAMAWVVMVIAAVVSFVDSTQLSSLFSNK